MSKKKAKKNPYKEALDKIKEIESKNIIQGSVHIMTEEDRKLIDTPITTRPTVDLFVKNGKVYISVPLDKYRITPR